MIPPRVNALLEEGCTDHRVWAVLAGDLERELIDERRGREKDAAVASAAIRGLQARLAKQPHPKGTENG